MSFYRNSFAATAIAAGVLIGAPASSYALTNGDFSSGLSGWTKSGTVGVGTEADYNAPAIGGSGNDPSVSQFAAFGWGNLGGFNSISQVLSTTVGQAYELTFSYFGFGPSNGQGLFAQVGTDTSGSYFPASWGANFDALFKTVTISFTASAASTLLSFTNFSNAGDNSDILLANVKLTAVPGPVAAAGLPGVLALLGYGLYRRRRPAA
jgi:hypothetical protein